MPQSDVRVYSNRVTVTVAVLPQAASAASAPQRLAAGAGEALAALAHTEECTQQQLNVWCVGPGDGEPPILERWRAVVLPAATDAGCAVHDGGSVEPQSPPWRALVRMADVAAGTITRTLAIPPSHLADDLD